jgi:DnaJ like chaperone protein
MRGICTLLGAVAGFLLARFNPLDGLLVGGGLGFLAGAWLDHNAAAVGGAAAAPHMPLSDLFFITTFELMGHVAKSDGQVSESEIAAARGLMRELGLSERDVRVAIACFQRGKSPGFDVERVTARLRAACGAQHDLIGTFLEFQLRVALAGNGLSPPARRILTRVADQLGMSGLEFARLEASLRARGAAASLDPLARSYQELEVEPTAGDADVTRAYRRQMSRHHPDKLVANGLPESMAGVAKEKTQRIQEAYEAIRAARGMR